jgi:transposase
MPKQPRIDSTLLAKAQQMLARATNLDEFRRAQAILLPALAHTSLEKTAALLGVGRTTVVRYQRRVRVSLQNPATNRPAWGGRRRALLSFAQEVEFLAPWIEQAKSAGILVVSPLRAALAERLGRKVAASVVYRLLARHGWRKLSPDTKHPKGDPEAQAEWKKNSRKSWRSCSPPARCKDAPSA